MSSSIPKALLDLVSHGGTATPFDELAALFPELVSLSGCPQDAEWHAEGDVAIHTTMVVEALRAMPEWRRLADPRRLSVFLACLLHDIGKPETTRMDGDGRVTSRGHSRVGAMLARRALYRLGLPLAIREHVCALIARHQLPFYLIDKPDLEWQVIEISHTAGCADLALVAEADARGRRAVDQGRLLDNVALFREYAAEAGVLDTPFPFPSDHARFAYFRDRERSPLAPAWDDTRVEVTVMSGLPGSGKDTWIRNHAAGLPVVSLDALREILGVEPGEAQGAVVQAAMESARALLRKGEPFVWNATNVSRDLRASVIDRMAAYRARIRIVYCEVAEPLLFAQNRAREARVPETVMQRLLGKWHVPDRTECHTLLLAGDGQNS